MTSHIDSDQKLAFVKELEGEVNVTKNDTVFMFHFDLPLKVIRKDGGGWDVMDSAYSSHFLPLMQELKRQDKYKVKFIGWPGIHVTKEAEQIEITTFLEDFDCIPVFPPQSEFEEFLHFSESFLWPIFHDVMLFYANAN